GAAAGAATRFGTFRQAVRGTGAPTAEARTTTDDEPAAEPPAAAPSDGTPTTNAPHPEGTPS
ncbi:hypothetical protein AB0F57_33530, partial [Streptomyces tanashiensis]